MERIPIKSDAKMFDLAVSRYQLLLAQGLSWLNHSFGICEFLTEVKDGKKFTSANLYVGKDKYEQIMPCKELGNFSFFILRDPQEINQSNKRLISSPFSLIIWYNVEEVSSSPSARNREAIKAYILALLESAHSPYLQISKVYEKPESVFADFSYDHTKNQFLMHPYAGLRIDGTITANVPCFINGAYDFSFDESFDIPRLQ